MNPQKTCKFQTKLVPKLKPTHECTTIPQEICQLKFTTPREEPVPFMSKWCIDPNEEVVPDSTYDENDAADDPLGPETTESSRPDALYGAPGGGPADYSEDYEEEDLAIPPPPPEPEADEPFEQTESTYQEPVYDDYEDSASSALDTGYGSPTAPAPAPAPRQGGPRRGGNGGPRRNNRPTGKRLRLTEK